MATTNTKHLAWIAEYTSEQVTRLLRSSDIEWAASIFAVDVLRKLNVGVERPTAIEQAKKLWPEMVEVALRNFPQYGVEV